MESNLRQLRRYGRMSLVDLAEKSGVATSTIGDVEQGTVPNVHTGIHLARALETTAEVLFPC